MPEEVRYSRKGVISIQNKNNECFCWCYIKHLNPINKKTEGIKKCDKETIANLDYKDIKFLVFKKSYHKIELENNIGINVFGYKKKQV